MFPLVREAIDAVMPVERLRFISFSHYEADECGALNEFLAVAPHAVPLCGQIAAMVSVNDFARSRARTKRFPTVASASPSALRRDVAMR
jgi:flavorubredoxin